MFCFISFYFDAGTCYGKASFELAILLCELPKDRDIGIKSDNGRHSWGLELTATSPCLARTEIEVLLLLVVVVLILST